ncbi:MAG: phosphoribosyl-AMP cyclohydrolase [Verrucomicrobiota bacterium JB024]|nr:phosphoribosyl-AMP cyclohydrolase [Verrucomicrobiota bacterium JB024]
MNKTPLSTLFSTRESVQQVEEGEWLAPKFDDKGTIPCVTLHAETREVLMFAFMNAEALALTIETGLAHYWSRSRKKLWKKGESSGMFQHVQRMLVDDDQDCVVIEVTLTVPEAGGEEASCHVGYRSCFYREVPVGGDVAEKPLRLKFVEDRKAFDPHAVYGDAPNPTQL